MTALPGDDPVARHRLPARTTTYWRLRAALWGTAITALTVWGAVGLDWFNAPIRWTVAGIAAGWFLVVGVILRPPIRRSLFWYSVSDTEIDLQHGLLVQTRTVVPMSRVQHLKSEQGLLERRFRLADLHIHTAAGTVEIRGLDQAEATNVRTRIGLLAQLSDEL